LTAEGEKNIEDIQIGDWVISDNPLTPGELESKQVVDIFSRQVDNVISLYIDGEVISTTREHPFWTPNQGWVAAEELEIGSLLQLEDGQIVDIDLIERVAGNFSVYNFHVDDFHTYFVSSLHILVHNVSPDDDIWEQAENDLAELGGFTNKPDTKSWSKGSFNSPDDSLSDHFAKHGKEVGANSVNEYLEQAEIFKDQVVSNSVPSRPVPGPTPNVNRYIDDNKYIDLTDEGEIVSFGTID
jgi:hypothetical protein